MGDLVERGEGFQLVVLAVQSDMADSARVRCHIIAL